MQLDIKALLFYMSTSTSTKKYGAIMEDLFKEFEVNINVDFDLMKRQKRLQIINESEDEHVNDILDLR